MTISSRRRWGVPVLVLLTAAGTALVLSPNADSATRPALAFGTVTTAANTPVAGAHVSLFAEPVNLPTGGQTVTIPVLTTTTTDANGDYALVLPAGYTGAGAIDPDTGMITFDVSIDGKITTFTQALNATTGTRVTKTGRTMSTSTALLADVPSSPVPAKAADGTPSQITSPDPVISFFEPTEQPTFDGSEALSVTHAKNLGRHWSLVGTWFSYSDAVTARFEYSNGADSSIGVGISSPGGPVSTSAGVTHSESSTTSQGYGWRPGKVMHSYYTMFHFGRYRYRTCTKVCGPITYRDRADGYWGGAVVQKDADQTGYNDCAFYGRGTDFRRTNTKATRWTGGVEISKAIGIDLSIQTGYTNEATTSVHFNGGARLCGKYDGPSGNPGALMARRPA